MEFLSTIITSSAVGTIVGAALVFLFQKAVSTKIEHAIRHEYDAKLSQLKTDAEHSNQIATERLKAEFVSLQANQSAAFNALAEGHKQTHARTLDAIDTLWNEVVKLKINVPHAIVLMNVLSREEYSCLVDDLREQTETAANSVMLNDVDESAIQRARLHAGSNLYETFFSYRQILGRILVQLRTGLEQNALEAWYEESGMRSILNVTFSKDELDFILRDDINTIAKALSTLEQRFLATAANIVSGKEAAMEAVEAGGGIIEVARRLDLESLKLGD